jgi:hypothetical protein
MPAEQSATLNFAHATEVGRVWSKLVGAGFSETMLCRWLGAPRLSDARYLAPRRARGRQIGLAAWMALLVGGETVVGLDGVEPLVAAGLCRRDGNGVRATVTALPMRGAIVVADRFDAGANAVGAPDLSALNTLASLPRRAGRALDVGCGAGPLALWMATCGATVTAADVDERALEFARFNAAANGRTVEVCAADVFEGVPPGRFDVIVFNAPLEAAGHALSDEAPRYVSAPGAEGLALRFLDGLAERLEESGEALLHCQLTSAVGARLEELAMRRRVLEIVFAESVDGTPHALTVIAPGSGRRRVRVPLGPVCLHLARPIVDGYLPMPVLSPTATPVPPPWLELRESSQLGAAPPAWRARSFGGQPLDDESHALLLRLDGRSLGELALDDADTGRVAELVEHGLVLVR